MKKVYFLSLTIIAMIFYGNFTKAQLVAGSIYLPGHYLEIGQTSYGSFGAPPPPASYYPYPSGSYMAEVYDYGHDGWTVGAPATMGDYTYPGSPFEGWGIQVGSSAQLNWAFTSSGAITGTGSLTGSNVSYTNTGGSLKGNWLGSCGPGGQLVLKMETRVDTNASWVVITTKMYNTGATALNNIYYVRSCDPDNDEAHGGGFPTDNYNYFQNDAAHRVEVAGIGQVYTYAFLGLCTKDQRARCFVYNYWPMNYGCTDLSEPWLTYPGGGGALTTFFTTLTNDPGDIGIALEYYICSIPAHDSAVVSCAYTFLNSRWGIDSAFPEPTIVVNGTPVTPPPAPASTSTTFNACAIPGMTTLDVSLSYATTGVWTWSTWTWSPGVGLSATTGTSVVIDLTVIPGTITYTITGTDSLPGSSCSPGNRRTMYLTVITCNNIWATVNYPCQGDSLLLVCHSDSLGAIGATYSWSLLGGTWTSTLQSPFIYPVSFADTGTYRVIRTNSTGNDTATVHVSIHPKPVVSLSNNGDSLCSSYGLLDTLKLYSVPNVAGYVYSWTGPNSFTSTMEFPTIIPYTYSDTGQYYLRVTDTHGCWDTVSVFAGIIPPIQTPTITGVSHYCTGDPFVPFGITLMPGATALWYTDSVGGVGSTTAPVINTSYVQTVTFYASQIEGICEGLRGSFTVVVDSTPPPPVMGSNTPICADSTLQLTSSDGLGGISYAWSGPNSFTSTRQNPTIVNAQTNASGIYALTVTVGATGCHNSNTTTVVVNPTPAPPVVTADSPCDGGYMHLWADGSGIPGENYSWNGPAGFTSATATPVVYPAVLGVNDGIYTVVATIGVCPSVPVTVKTRIFANPPAPVTYDRAYCQYAPTSPLRADSLTDVETDIPDFLTWYVASTGSMTIPEPYYPSDSVPGTFTWYVTQTTDRGCVSPRAAINIHILDKPDFLEIPSSPFACQDSSVVVRYFGPNYDSLTYAWSLPFGSLLVGGALDSPSVQIQFDSVFHDTVSLTATDHKWGISCTTKNTITIRVVPMPTAHFYINPSVCQSDTVNIELTDRSDNAYSYIWNFDFTGTDAIITASSNTYGPYGVRWDGYGAKIVTVIPVTIEGCKGLKIYDTVEVRSLPNSSFNEGHGGRICAEDSVLFFADMGDSANYTYTWAPEHFFKNTNGSRVYGRVETASNITLYITDAFGCKSETSYWFDPESCCTVSFPSGFTPNGNGYNDKFRPIYSGYHRFHIFRIQNRWGQTVYESTNNNMEWDGTYGGIPQDIGVYYYYLKYDCGNKTIEKRGDITLIR